MDVRPGWFIQTNLAEWQISDGADAIRFFQLALFKDPAKWDALALRVEHSALNEDTTFHDIYGEEIQFPKTV